MTDDTLEQRMRDLIDRLENLPYIKPANAREHWMQYGMDEAYDNALDWLHTNVLQEQR